MSEDIKDLYGLNISGYSVLEKVYESYQSIVVKAKTSLGANVLMKIINEEFPSSETIAGFQLEYELLKELNSPNVVKVLDLLHFGSRLCLVYEDDGSIAIKKFFTKPASIELGVQIGIDMVKALKALKQNGIIHRDINPANMIINTNTLRCKLIDFGLAVKAEEHRVDFGGKFLEGSLKFLAPEQTGRVAETVDYRTDFYGLGASLYWLFSGNEPVHGQSLLEIVHAHLVKKPPSLDNLPKPLAAIIDKLLAKDPAHRYQSHDILLRDLKYCRDSLSENSDFLIAQGDLNPKIVFPERLLGRQTELDFLQKSLDEAKNSLGLVLVYGEAGIGKSSILKELSYYNPRALTVMNRYDSLQRKVPYYGLRHGFDNLFNSLFSRQDKECLLLAKHIKEGMGPYLRVIVDFFPRLALLVGEQESPVSVDWLENKNRFELAFCQFIRVLASTDQEIILFFDDVQWIDRASLDLLELLLEDKSIKNTLLVLSYRESSVQGTYFYREFLLHLKELELNVAHLELQPLKPKYLYDFFEYVLLRKDDELIAFIDLVYRHTSGNPFYLKQFIFKLVEDKLLWVDTERGYWCYDLQKISSLGVAENIVEFLIQDLGDLSEDSLWLLQFAACLGMRFNLGNLLDLTSCSLSDLRQAMLDGVEARYLLPLDDNFSLLSFSVPEETIMACVSQISFVFSHDRVHQALLVLLEPTKANEINLKIGKFYKEKLPKNHSDSDLFTVLHYMNMVEHLVSDKEERYALSELNYIAGMKALKSIAYEAAELYFESSKVYLGTEYPDFAWKIDLGILSSSYLLGSFMRVDSLAEEMLQTNDAILKSQVCEILLLSLIARNDSTKSLEVGRKALGFLGFPIAKKSSVIALLNSFSKTKWVLRNKDIKYLASHKEMDDQRALAAMKILMQMTAPAYFVEPLLFPIIVFQMVRLSVKYGNAPSSAYGYGVYGVLLCAAFKEIDRGFLFGEFGLNLLSKLKSNDLEAKLLMVFNMSVSHWKRPMRLSIPAFRRGYSSAIEYGDLEYAALNGVAFCVYSFLSGVELKDVLQNFANYESSLQDLKQNTYLSLHNVIYHAVRQISDSVESSIADRESWHKEMIADLEGKSNKTTLCIYYVFDAMTAYLFADPTRALVSAKQGVALKDAILGTGYLPVLMFYYGLTIVFLRRSGSLRGMSWQREKLALTGIIKQFAFWSNFSKENYQHKYFLLKAEFLHLKGSSWLAMNFYDKALTGAKENQYLNDEALINELMGNFYAQQGLSRPAMQALKRSLVSYQQWGAIAKVERLKLKYPDLQTLPSEEIVHGSVSLDSNVHASMDLETVTKVSQVISSEISLNDLLGELLRLVVENLCAEKGVLLLKRNEVYLEACVSDGGNELSLKDVEIHSSNIYEHLIAYVENTREMVISENYRLDSRFSEYLSDDDLKSVLCMPLLNKNKYIGVLYLENNYSSGVFNARSLEFVISPRKTQEKTTKNARIHPLLLKNY